MCRSGRPWILFDRPAHTFVGHFIGSPGMNILPCEVRDGGAFFEGQSVALEGPLKDTGGAATEIGVRPEFVQIGAAGIAATVRKAVDLGRHKVVEAVVGDTRINAITEGDIPGRGNTVHLQFVPAQTRVYADGWIATERAAQ